MTIAKHTITIFNTYFIDGATDYDPYDPRPPSAFPPTTAYSRTILKCQWEDTIDRQANTNGITQVNNLISIIIPKVKGMKPYLPRADYDKLDNAQKPNYWTLATSGEVFLGEVPEITAIYKMENARNDFRHCIIKGIEDYFNQPVLPHFEITGI